MTTGLCKGDSASVAEHLIKRHRTKLIAYAKEIIRNDLAAEDVVAECFIKFWMHQNKFDSHNAAISYLYKIAKNTCLNHLKSEKYKQKRLSAINTQMIDDNNDSDGQEFYKVLEDVLTAVGNLPPLCKEIFILCTVKGFSYKKVASKLNISVNTVKTQRSRAITKIRSFLPTSCIINY
jgi:RNA polymerase sigma-70 factor, Bacteroides expansion family 1